ncbi:hypothetical protein IE077_004426 [Cardiosporidium cionae]|uniref:Uncharacterized protein n=1 Tax=Cardiosporidium cionae TaxID=476202 RepID=A0ABQ7JFE6_9APIC|nr:hypothetical protein IE077_004426 [Cardiosporidium cionae]|eukprot:KAF8822752.1 hypothetical protein IE077_004426 [Cardiosporidium cionae]
MLFIRRSCNFFCRIVSSSSHSVIKSLRRSTAAIFGGNISSSVWEQIQRRQNQTCLEESIEKAKRRFRPMHLYKENFELWPVGKSFLDGETVDDIAASSVTMANPLLSHPNRAQAWPRAFLPNSLFELAGHDESAFELYHLLSKYAPNTSETIETKIKKQGEQQHQTVLFSRREKKVSNSFSQESSSKPQIIILAYPENVGARRLLQLVCYACHLYPIYETKVKKTNGTNKHFFRNTYGLEPLSIYEMDKLDKLALQDVLPRGRCVLLYERTRQCNSSASYTMGSTHSPSGSNLSPAALLDLVSEEENVRVVELQTPPDLVILFSKKWPGYYYEKCDALNERIIVETFGISACHAIAESLFRGVSESSVYQILSSCRRLYGNVSFDMILNRLHFAYSCIPFKTVISLEDSNAQDKLEVLAIDEAKGIEHISHLLPCPSTTLSSTSLVSEKAAENLFDLSIQFSLSNGVANPLDFPCTDPADFFRATFIALHNSFCFHSFSNLLEKLSPRTGDFMDTLCLPLIKFDTLHLVENANGGTDVSCKKDIVSCDDAFSRKEEYRKDLNRYNSLLECFSLFSEIVAVERLTETFQPAYTNDFIERHSHSGAASSATSSMNLQNGLSNSLNMGTTCSNSFSGSKLTSVEQKFGSGIAIPSIVMGTSMGALNSFRSTSGYFPSAFELIGDLALSIPTYLQHYDRFHPHSDCIEKNKHRDQTGMPAPSLSSQGNMESTEADFSLDEEITLSTRCSCTSKVESQNSFTSLDISLNTIHDGTSPLDALPLYIQRCCNTLPLSTNTLISTPSIVSIPSSRSKPFEMRKKMEKAQNMLMQSLKVARKLYSIFLTPLTITEMKRNERSLVPLMKRLLVESDAYKSQQSKFILKGKPKKNTVNRKNLHPRDRRNSKVTVIEGDRYKDIFNI